MRLVWQQGLCRCNQINMRSSGWVSSNRTGVLVRKETHKVNALWRWKWRERLQEARMTPPQRLCGQHDPADTFILDFLPPEPRDHQFLLFLVTSLWLYYGSPRKLKQLSSPLVERIKWATERATPDPGSHSRLRKQGSDYPPSRAAQQKRGLLQVPGEILF